MSNFKFSPADLYKFCDPQYDVTKGCNTLRIGTLWGFRKEENELLRDAGEGKYDVKLTFPKLTPVSETWLSEFDFGSSGSMSIKTLQEQGGKTLIDEVSFEGSWPDCWIFCVSRGQHAIGNISEAYANSWKITESETLRFARLIGRLLWERLQTADLPAYLNQKYTFQELKDGLAINMDVGDVIYRDRTTHITSEQDFPVEKVRELKKKYPIYQATPF